MRFHSARPVTLDSESYADSGTSEVLAVEKVYFMGYRKILVILNEPLDAEMESFSRIITWLAFPTSRSARRAALDRKRGFAEAVEFIQNPPQDAEIHVICPGKTLPAARFCRSQELVGMTYEIGLDKGQAERDALRNFLKSEAPNLSRTSRKSQKTNYKLQIKTQIPMSNKTITFSDFV